MSKPQSPQQELDPYYTRAQTATACLAKLDEWLPDLDADLYVESSAGDGVFLVRLPTPRIGLDIAPAAPGIETADFLAWTPPADAGRIVVVGNPPFGRAASTAIAFMNHAATFADVIAMILPASMSKGSMQDRLDPFLHLVDEMPLPQEPFRFGEETRKVNAVFQVWRREKTHREKSVRPSRHADFDFVPDVKKADFVVRRVGGAAGKILARPAGSDSLHGYSPSSNLFVRANGVAPGVLRARFEAIDFDEVRNRAAAHPSVSKSDIVALYAAQVALEAASQGAARTQVEPAEPAPSALVAPAKAQEGDLVAMLVHHDRLDPEGCLAPDAIEFRQRHGDAFGTVLQGMLDKDQGRRAGRLLGEVFADDGRPGDRTAAPGDVSVLFETALVRFEAGGALRIEPRGDASGRVPRMEAIVEACRLACDWLGEVMEQRPPDPVQGLP